MKKPSSEDENFRKKIYRMVNAPTNEILNKNIEYDELYENQYWSNDMSKDFRYYFSTTGKRMSVLSKECLERLFNHYNNEIDSEEEIYKSISL